MAGLYSTSTRPPRVYEHTIQQSLHLCPDAIVIRCSECVIRTFITRIRVTAAGCSRPSRASFFRFFRGEVRNSRTGRTGSSELPKDSARLVSRAHKCSYSWHPANKRRKRPLLAGTRPACRLSQGPAVQAERCPLPTCRPESMRAVGWVDGTGGALSPAFFASTALRAPTPRDQLCRCRPIRQRQGE